MNESLLQVRNLKKYFITQKGFLSHTPKVLKAVDDVSFDLNYEETFGLVGESGCGKSTLGKTVLKLYPLTDGKVIFEGEDITDYPVNQMRNVRREMQIIFQNPFSSLNPRKTVYDIIKAPLDIFGKGSHQEKREQIVSILNEVGLDDSYLSKYPHQMSGGQCQRIVIARALINNPKFILCDEPLSALDVSVRSQVINLMLDLQKRKNLSYLFISHDLSVVKYLCDTVSVMYLGKIVESGKNKSLFSNPLHPYTKALISAIPIPDVNKKRNKIILQGDVPSPLNPPSGCKFHTRCPYVMEKCRKVEPELLSIEADHMVSCHLFE